MKNLVLILLALFVVYMISKKRAAAAAAAAQPAGSNVQLSTTENPVTGSPSLPQPGDPNIIVINGTSGDGYNDQLSGPDDFNPSGTIELPA